MNFLFDVDNTLTAPRSQLDGEFKSFLMDWVSDKSVYIVSSIGYERLKWQLDGLEQYVAGVFGSSGNELWAGGVSIYANEVEWSEYTIEYLSSLVKSSRTEFTTGNYIEYRVGALNISPIGIDAPVDEKTKYKELYPNELLQMRAQIVTCFHGFHVSYGGGTSLEVCIYGKEQVLDHMKPPVTFFCDRAYPGGNDYELSRCLLDEDVVQVTCWQDTYEILKNE
jgi:hypothetical protein